MKQTGLLERQPGVLSQEVGVGRFLQLGRRSRSRRHRRHQGLLERVSW